uniref:Pentatricopeptide repeat-containing protein n=1 Tax=Opuntia streptacantha TaxID=393608 RepID=A0A7C9A3V1_OPUST
MRATAFVFVRGLSGAFHRAVGAQINKSWSFAAFCSTQTVNGQLGFDNSNSNGGEKPNILSLRIERLPRGEPVGLVFQGWMGEGFPVHRGDIFHAINRLRKLKLNKRALEVMEWIIREKPYRPKELDYSYLLEFTIKLHGISQGNSSLRFWLR